MRADTETGETAGGRGNGRLKPVRPNAPKVLIVRSKTHAVHSVVVVDVPKTDTHVNARAKLRLI